MNSLNKSEIEPFNCRIHTQERPYICTIPGCSKRFKTISQRNGHVDTHNTENNYRVRTFYFATYIVYVYGFDRQRSDNRR